MSRIAVDLTPLSSTGENGGAKIVVLELLQHLSILNPQHDYILLTTKLNHQYLEFLDASNVCRYQVGTISDVRLLKKINAELFFCPFTTVNYFEPDVPIVSVVYDLQCYYYPLFFSRDDENYRKKSFIEASRLANRIICISEYVRQTILDNSNIDQQYVTTSYIRLSNRLKHEVFEKQLLTSFSLENNEYLLYPANFWHHKNHLKLIQAFKEYLHEHADSKLKLVFTGSPGKNMDYLVSMVQEFELMDKIIFLGFLTQEELSSIFYCCRALVFPSLYEGFGMPVLEAMSFDKPVICSNVTSLPEIAGNAAIFFNPDKIDEIKEAIAKIEKNNSLQELINLGHDQVKNFSDPNKMAQEYLDVFENVMQNFKPKYVRKIQGIYADGWTEGQVFITYEANTNSRHLVLNLSLPKLELAKLLKVKLINEAAKEITEYSISPGGNVQIQSMLSPTGGSIELFFDSVVQLSLEDPRNIACFLVECNIIYEDKTESFLPKEKECSFSIITIANKKSLANIKETVESVITQDVAQLEYLIISDENKFPSSIKNYDSRFTWVTKSSPRQAIAINEGLRLSSNDIIGFLPAGDKYCENRLNLVSDFFIKNPEIQVVYGEAQSSHSEQCCHPERSEGSNNYYKFHVFSHNDNLSSSNIEPWNFTRSYFESNLSKSAVFMRRNIINQFNLFNEHIDNYIDYEFWLRLSMHGVKFAYLPQQIVYSQAGIKYHVDPKSFKQINNLILQEFNTVPKQSIRYYAAAIMHQYINNDKNVASRLLFKLIYYCANFYWNQFANKKLSGKIKNFIRSLIPRSPNYYRKYE